MEEPRSGFATAKTSRGKSSVPPTAGEQRKADKATGVKRDFFGRIMKNTEKEEENVKGNGQRNGDGKGEARVWVSYHEGFSMAVKKPIGLAELMRGL